MTFFTRELCEKLQAVGCVSESGFYYVPVGTKILLNYLPDLKWPQDFSDRETQSFGWWDLCGGSERARENARIVWLGDEVFCNRVNEAVYHRHAIVDLPEDEVESYVWKTMKGSL